MVTRPRIKEHLLKQYPGRENEIGRYLERLPDEITNSARALSDFRRTLPEANYDSNLSRRKFNYSPVNR